MDFQDVCMPSAAAASLQQQSPRLRLDSARWVLAAARIQRFGDLFGQCRRVDALVEAFAAFGPAIFPRLGRELVRARECTWAIAP